MDDILKISIRGKEYIYDTISNKLFPLNKIEVYFELSHKLKIVVSGIEYTLNISLKEFIKEVLDTPSKNITNIKL